MIEALSHLLCTLLLYQIFAACWLLQYVLESLLCVHENSLMMAASCWDTSVEPAVATLNLFVCQFVIYFLHPPHNESVANVIVPAVATSKSQLKEKRN